MTRIATISQHQLTLFHSLNTQARLQDLQVQLASDKKAQAYSGIAADSARLISMETQRARIEQFMSNIATAEQRLASMDLAVAGTEDLAREFRALLDSALQAPDAAGVPIADFAADLRLMVVDLLNTHDGQRYLFGGGGIDRPPVELDPANYTSVSLIESDGVTVDSSFYEAYYTQVLGNVLPFAQGSFYDQIYFEKNGVPPAGPLPADPDNPTLAEFVAEDPGLWRFYAGRMGSAEMLANPKIDYYQGDQLATVVRADDDLQVTYEIRADLPAFQQLLTALDAVASLPAGGNPGDPFQREILAEARAMVNNALDPLAAGSSKTLDELRAELTRARNNLAFTRERHDRQLVYTEGVIHDIENIDRTEVIVRLQSDQRALEASFAALSLIQSLSLLDFI